jgi:hypothetical protein
MYSLDVIIGLSEIIIELALCLVALVCTEN